MKKISILLSLGVASLLGGCVVYDDTRHGSYSYHYNSLDGSYYRESGVYSRYRQLPPPPPPKNGVWHDNRPHNDNRPNYRPEHGRPDGQRPGEQGRPDGLNRPGNYGGKGNGSDRVEQRPPQGSNDGERPPNRDRNEPPVFGR